MVDIKNVKRELLNIKSAIDSKEGWFWVNQKIILIFFAARKQLFSLFIKVGDS